MWSKSNHYALLVGMQINTAAVENSVKVSQKMKNRTTIWGASLVAQWLRTCLPMQGTLVRALVWEDPTCRGAAGPVSHNY